MLVFDFLSIKLYIGKGDTVERNDDIGRLAGMLILSRITRKKVYGIVQSASCELHGSRVYHKTA